MDSETLPFPSVFGRKAGSFTESVINEQVSLYVKAHCSPLGSVL